MVQILKLRYLNAHLHIGMANWKKVYLLYPAVTFLHPEVERGRLVYRAKGSSKRYSYTQIKKGLLKKSFSITQEIPNWLLP